MRLNLSMRLTAGVMALTLLDLCNAPVFGENEPRFKNTQVGDPANPEEVVIQIQLPAGFDVTVFASEPDVQQPIALTTDERGRLWVAENYTYAELPVNFDDGQRDRIVILEDVDHDGRFDKRTVFWDGASKLTSVEIGNGGVWALCPPQLLFIRDNNGDDRADGPPQVVLDGWNDSSVRHNIVNGLKWGPDGWLYGRHGILASSLVGKPNATPSQRVKLNCGIWRYHPVHEIFEVVAHGTTNPWGFDYDDHGQMFFINTVIGHLWHLVPGAHYRRMYGSDFNPHTYELIDQCADHVHWDTGEKWSDIRRGVSDTTLAKGGGHAHSGLMIYLGDNWPNDYRNTVFTINFHGARLNNDHLARHNSGYVGTHGKDMFLANDKWFRGIDLIYGPDGGVYIADWSDAGECHDTDGIHRTSGRVYKVTYGRPKRPASIDLAKCDDLELVQFQVHANDWYVRQSRRLLQERSATGRDMTDTKRALHDLFENNADVTRKLRAMWCLYVIGAAKPSWLIDKLENADEHVRLWAVRLLTDLGTVNPQVAARFAKLARTESSTLVRLFLASALQRMPVETRWDVATGLVSHADDADDKTLSLMIWYGIEEAVPVDRSRAILLAEESRASARPSTHRSACDRRS